MKKIILTMLIMANISLFAFEHNTGFIPVEDLEDFSIKHNGVKMNNFTLSEKSSWTTKSMVNLGVSFSVKNKNTDSKHFSLIIVGLNKKNKIIWALNAEPMMGILSGKKTDSISNDTLVMPGTLAETTKVFVKITGDF